MAFRNFFKTLTIKKAFIVWLIAMGVSVIFSKDINFSLWGSIERGEGYYQYILYFVFFIFLTEFFVKKEQWKKIFVVVTFIGIINSILIIFQFVCGLEPETFNGLVFNISKCSWQGGLRPEIFIGNPAFVAGYMLLIILITGLTALIVDNKYVFWFIPIGLLEIFSLWMVGIRGAYLGAIIGIIIYLFLRYFIKK